MRSRQNFLTSLLSKLNGSRDVTVVVQGAAGSGKTWLLEELSKQLEPQPHIYVRAHPSEADWPLSGLMMWLSNLPLDRPIDVEKFLPTSPGQQIDTYALARHLQRLLPQHLETGTVVLFDDMDLIDPASLKILGYLATTLRGIRIRLVGTITCESTPKELSSMQVLTLHALTRGESRNLARTYAGPTADTAVLDLVTAQAHGIPGEILAQLEVLGASQRSGQRPLILPLHPSSRYLSKLSKLRQSLSPNQLNILQLAASGPCCEHSTLLESGADPADLDELTRRGLIEQKGNAVRVTDCALRSALYWSQTAEQRGARHEQLFATSSHEAMKLFHQSFVQCGTASAVSMLMASDELLSQGRTAAAIEVTERALNLDTSDPQIPPLLTRLVKDFFEAAELQMARRYLNFAKQHAPDAASELTLLALQVQLCAAQGRPTPELDVPAILAAHQKSLTIPCGQLLSVLSCAYALRENLSAAREALATASLLLEAAEGQQRVALEQAGIFVAALELDHDTLLRKYQAVLGSPEETTPLEVRQSLAMALLNVGYHSEAREVLARLNNPLGQGPSPLLQRLTCLLTAANAIQNENVPQALSLVERWISLDGPSLFEPMPQLIQAWYWMIKNRQDMADVFFERMQPRRMGEISPKLLARISMLAGDQALMTGQPQRAVEAYRTTLRSYQDAADIRFVRTTAHLIEALVLMGRTDQAVAEYRARQELMAQVPGRRAKLAMRFAQALVLEGEAAIGRFQTLLGQWTPSDSSFELARIRHALGHRLQAMDQPAAAREHLLAARNLYRSLGAKAWVSNVEQALKARVPLASTAAPIDFSQEEFQVVRMVHEGLTNKAIAKKLYISVSAVEARLTKLYRRTGAKNRQQLASRFTEVETSRL